MRRLVLLLTLLLVAAACGQQTAAPATTGSSASSGSTTTADGTTEPDRVAGTPELLDFQAQTVSGQPFDGADYAGQDLMVWFWAPW